MLVHNLLPANGYIVYNDGADTILVDTGAPVTIRRGSSGVGSFVTRLRTMVNNLPGPMGDIFRGLMAGRTDEDIMDLFRSPEGRMLASQMGIDVDSLDVSDVDTAKLMGVDFDSIVNHIGQPVNVIMGNDQLEKSKVLVDYSRGIITFGDNVSLTGTVVLCSLSANYLVVKAKINGATRKVFFDTGAPTSYVSEAWLDGCPKVGEAEDFHPLVGFFTAPVYSAPVNFAGRSANVEIGVLPNKLQAMLETQGGLIAGEGTDGVIGRGFFPSNKMLLDIAGRTITFGE